MKKFALLLIILSLLTGCSTSGGIYSRDDATHGEFSPGRTLLGVLAVAGAVAIAKGGGGGGYTASGYAWDYQPGDGQWVCRDKSNGEYAFKENCAGLPLVDYWP